MNKKDKFYFDNFIDAATACCDSADYLLHCLSHYDVKKLPEMLEKMHKYEHLGDTKKHEMSTALAKAFVTPVDREDLALISNNIDHVNDRLEEVLQRFYVDDLKSVTPEAIEFVQKLVVCTNQMKELLVEFPNFKKPARLHELIIELSNSEEECDRLYLEATHNVRGQFTDVLDVMFWREIYKKMEDCADACEHVGDCIETVVMKNT